MADARPVFDFHGSLELARSMWSFAERLAATSGERRTARDTSLAEWLGVYGDQYREAATNEDTSESNILTNLGTEATMVSFGWLSAVQLMNGVLYAEAIEDQERHLERRKAEAERERERRQNAVMEFFSDVGDLGSQFFSGSESPFDYVPRPRDFEAPAAPGFVAPGGFLASYYRSGDYMYINYVSYVPG